MSLPARSRAARAALTAAVLVVAGCEGRSPNLLSPRFNTSTDQGGNLTVCKEGTSGTFDITENGVSTGLVMLSSGECRLVADAVPLAVVAGVTEVAAAGIILDSMVVEVRWQGDPVATRTVLTGTNTFAAGIGDQFVKVTYYNRVVGEGRMTGGGGQITIGDVFVSRGFTIHCDIVLSNNIEVNWPDNKFHITRPLTSALCIDDPAISPVPPAAPFDTFIGVAAGEHNGVPGATLHFTFVDDGERGGGAHDFASLKIWDANGNVVLDVPLSPLDRGNIQAHYDQPHGNKP